MPTLDRSVAFGQRDVTFSRSRIVGDLPEARFWTVSVLPTIRELMVKMIIAVGIEKSNSKTPQLRSPSAFAQQ
jgi:hypothetical protein